MTPVIQDVAVGRFVDYVTELASMTGLDFEDVLVDQVGSVLNLCLKWTPAASRASVLKRVSKHNNYLEFPSGHVIAVWKKASWALMFLDDSNWTPDMARNGKSPPKVVKGGKTWHQVQGGDRRWSPERWARYHAYEARAKSVEKDPKKALKSRGIAKQTWLQIADDLGIKLKGEKKWIRNARPQNGQTYKNGIAKKVLQVAAAYIEFSNDNFLVVKKLNGWNILQNAINTRRRAFDIEMKKNVFDNIKLRAKRYPGLFTDTSGK